MEVIEAPQRLIKRRVMEVLELVGLKSKANREPSQLSGGEQQRIAIARAIVNNPPSLLRTSLQVTWIRKPRGASCAG